MSSTVSGSPSIAAARARTVPAARRRRPEGLGADLLAVAAGLGLAATVLLTVGDESLSGLSAPGGVATALGRLAGMLGAYLMVILVLLMARLPVIEEVAGQDRLTRWHRRLGPWPIALIGAHGVLITIGYAQQSGSAVPTQVWTLLSTYPGVLAATAGFALIAAAGITSHRAIKARMTHETWWVIHIYIYIALALAFSHQLSTGASFVGHPAARVFWTVLWAGSAALVLAYRIGLPLARSFRHRLRVVAVTPEGPGALSVLCRGRALDRLPIRGGQFLQWRILRRGLWWQAHPYSVSSLSGSQLRFTVNVEGDHGAALAALEPGTRVAFEGPYGVFTDDARSSDRVLLVGAGLGAAPLRALLEDLPETVEATVILRASTSDGVLLREEFESLLSRRRRGALVELVGPRSEVRLDADRLRDLVPDIRERDIFICGPAGFKDLFERAARTAGVAPGRLHSEAFEL